MRKLQGEARARTSRQSVMETPADSPVTEMPNELSENIDISSPEQIVGVLRASDSQIFSGWREYEGVYDTAALATMVTIAESACEVLQTGSGRGHIVLSGCGTSGRLAFVIARTFNAHLTSLSLSRPALFHYLVAGGDAALLKSEEAIEDSWCAGSHDLEEVTSEMDRVLFIGISCGLSAPYVAGQLDYCLQHSDKFTPALLGFNPLTSARRAVIRDSSKTYSDVVSQMKAHSHPILNPVLGPEAITGSTRMKGGSATKILLEVIFTLALEKMQNGTFRSTPASLLKAYELTFGHTYTSSAQTMAEALHTAGRCLQSGGHVYYLGTGTPGIMAVIDASECPPTFGVDYGTVRGFVAGGYAALGNRRGSLSARHSDYELNISYFTSSILPHLTTADCIVVVVEERVALETGLPWIPPHPSNQSSRPHTIAVVVSTDDVTEINTSHYDHTVVVRLPWQPLSRYWSRDVSRDLLLEAGVKLILNAISTGAHVISGKVLGNRMIDLRVSNSKLYHRAIGIIQNFSGVSEESARQCLLTAIYGEEIPTCDRDNMSRHIATATSIDKVVPVALLLSTGLHTVSSARLALGQTPVVRHILAQTKHSTNKSTT